MLKLNRAGVTISTLAVAAALGGCANFGSANHVNGFVGKIDKTNIGVATRAQMALEKGDHATAVSLAERAVENSPTDAGFRRLLGNAYLAAGRFASAEAAYKDALSLMPGQPGVALKVVLAQLAQGKAEQALATLDASRDQIDAADAGLAMALAGQPGNAVMTLDEAARQPGADGRVRQNLALAHALAGDWTAARTIAAQDVPGDQLDARIAEWMNFTKAGSAGQKVASLIGVSPAAADPGQPVRLALDAKALPRFAQAAPTAQPAVVPPAAPVEVAAADPVPQPSFPAPAADPLPAAVADAAAELPSSAPVAAPAEPALAEMVDSIRREPVKASGALPKVSELRRTAAIRFGKSGVVVQLGAYASPKGVQSGWSNVSRRHAALRSYVPASARFAGRKGTVYRLSVKGFATDREARLLCEQLKRSGAACFVRSQAGDSPVRFVSR